MTTDAGVAEIRIRWRRYGHHGGRWRADLPPGHGIEHGWVESSSLATVEQVAGCVAARYGYPIVRDEPAADTRGETHG